MNLKIFDRACKYIDRMLISRRDDWREKKLYIRPNRYLVIELDRVTVSDIITGHYDEWERGTPTYMRLCITDKTGKRLDSRVVQYCYTREYKYDLDRLLCKEDKE